MNEFCLQRLQIRQTPCCRILINSYFYTESCQVSGTSVWKSSRLLALYLPKSGLIYSCWKETAKCLNVFETEQSFHLAVLLCKITWCYPAYSKAPVVYCYHIDTTQLSSLHRAPGFAHRISRWAALAVLSPSCYWGWGLIEVSSMHPIIMRPMSQTLGVL